jgi:hypothetical protein
MNCLGGSPNWDANSFKTAGEGVPDGVEAFDEGTGAIAHVLPGIAKTEAYSVNGGREGPDALG